MVIFFGLTICVKFPHLFQSFNVYNDHYLICFNKGIIMKVIIAGSRTINDYDALKNFVESVNWSIEEVVSGGCRGVDILGEQWAENNNVPKK